MVGRRRFILLAWALGMAAGTILASQEGPTESPSESGKSSVANCSGALVIRVVDHHGMALQAVSVELLTAGSERPRHLADKDGLITLSGLSCDQPHSVRISLPGFVSRRLIGLRVGEPDMPLLVVSLDEEFKERIALSCRAPIVDLEKASQSTTFSSGFLAGLPGGGGGVGPRRATKHRPKKNGARISNGR